MRDNVPPEEKLLKYLRKKDPQPLEETEDSRLHSSPAGQEKDFWFRHPAVYALLTDRKRLMECALGLLALSFLFWVFSFLYPLWGLDKKNIAVLREKAAPGTQINPAQIPGIDSYLGPVSGKNIFAAQEAVVQSAVQMGVNDLADLQLVGIISGDNPQAVIEDRRSQKSFYVNKGQLIGDFRVNDILEKKVILSRQGRQYELNF